MLQGVLTNMRDATYAVGDALWDTANLETYRVAVTGLSRAGKTVFLVSLISNLLAMTREVNGKRWNSLPALQDKLKKAGGSSRLVDVAVEPSGTQSIPRFAYEALRDGLANTAAPEWPAFTDRPSLIALRMLIEPASMFGRLKAGVGFGARHVRLELLDYPGEWLVDLPLLEMSYEQWSADVVSDLHERPRIGHAADFHRFLQGLKADAKADEAVCELGFELYRKVLARCREDHGLRWLQPGRFLMPGPWGDVPMLHFFPWTGSPSPVRNTLGAQLRDRFEAYKAEVRKTFFDPYFSTFDRQLVLVDVLGALFAGKTAFDDTCRALQRVGSSYARLLDGGIFGGKMQAVAFAATKSDHADDLQRDNLRRTLQSMVESAPDAVKPKLRRSFHAISSVRCTEDIDHRVEGRVVRAVEGVPLGETRRRPFSPGTVPAGVVPPHFWNNKYYVLPQLRPPAFPPGAAYPVPNLNLDEVLVSLLGDVL